MPFPCPRLLRFALLSSAALTFPLPAQTLAPGQVDFEAATLHARGFELRHEAHHHLMLADEAGHPDAFMEILRLRHNATSAPTPLAPELYIRFLQRAAARDDARALYYLGQAYRNGDGVPRDHALSLQYLKRSFELGYRYASMKIGDAYRQGRGVPRDLAQAKHWYQIAHEARQGGAQQALEQVPRMMQRDFQRLERAYEAALGKARDSANPTEQRIQAFTLFYQEVVRLSPDRKQAIEFIRTHYEDLADLDLKAVAGTIPVEARAELWPLVTRSQRVTVDEKFAASYTGPAPPPPVPGAADYRRGVVLANAGDYEAARLQFSNASKAGHMESSHQLALLLVDGKGGTTDLAQGRQLLRLAADSGIVAASTRLTELSAAERRATAPPPPAPPLVERTPAQLAEATRHALDSSQPVDAYLAARAWIRQDSDTPESLAAMAEVYFQLGAPAATVETVNRAFILDPAPALRRHLVALKARALAEVGEFVAAWAHARKLVREHPGSDDPVIKTVGSMQWIYYTTALSAGPRQALESRNAGVETKAGPTPPSLPVDRLMAAVTDGSAALADFDTAISSGVMTTALWEARLRLAEANQDWPEAVWSATEAWSEAPPTLHTWLEQRLAVNDEAMAGAIAAFRSQPDDDALDRLVEALSRDPGNDDGWSLLFQALLDREAHEAAAEILLNRWRLDLSLEPANGAALALATRLGRWDLLLSLSDQRVLADDSDSEAHFHRVLAAAALGLDSVANDSVAALRGTLYDNRARLLRSAARALESIDIFDRNTGLLPVYNQVGADEDLSSRLWLAVIVQSLNERISKPSTLMNDVRKGAPADFASHLDFIAGRTGSEAYLANYQGTADAAASVFLDRLVQAWRKPSPTTRSRLAELAGDAEFPLLFRVVAAATAAREREVSHLPIRVGDRYHASPFNTDWKTMWASLPPGQLVIAEGDFNLENVPADRIVRLIALPSGRPALQTPAVRPGLLWELAGFRLADPKTASNLRWNLPEGHVLALKDMILSRLDLSGDGQLWIEDSDWVRSKITARGIFATQVTFDQVHTTAPDRIEVADFSAMESTFALGQPQGGKASQAQFLRATLVRASSPLSVHPGLNLVLNETHLYAERAVDLSPAFLTAARSKLVGPVPVIGNVRGLDHVPLSLPSPKPALLVGPSRDSGHIAFFAIKDALRKAKPGDTVELRPETYLTLDTIEIPPGVTLSGPSTPSGASGSQTPPKATILLRGGIRGVALIHLGQGASRLRNITLSYPRDQKGDLGITTSGDAHLILDHVEFPDARLNPTNGGRDVIAGSGARVIIKNSFPGHISTEHGGQAVIFDTLQRSSLNQGLSGEGEVFAGYNPHRNFTLSGTDLRFYGRARTPGHFTYINGAAPPYQHARQARARAYFDTVLAEYRDRLPGELAAAPGVNERMALIKRVALRLGSINHTAKLDPDTFGRDLHQTFTPIFGKNRDDLGPLFEALHVGTYSHPRGSSTAHLALLTANDRARVQAYLRIALNQGVRQSDDQRETSITFLRAYPPGSMYHTRAVQAAIQGQSLEEFRKVVAAEQAERARVAELHRQWKEAAEEKERQARLVAQRQAEEEERIRNYQPAFNWNTFISQGAQFMQDYQRYRERGEFPSDYRQRVEGEERRARERSRR